MKFPQLDNMVMTVTLNIEPNADFQATPEEIAMAEKLGLPMLGSSVSESETEESLTAVLSGYVPMDLLFPNGLEGQENLRSASGQSGWGAVGHMTTEASMEFTDVVKTGNDIRKSFNDYNDFASRINKIMYNVQSGFDCLAEVPTTVNEAGTALLAVVGGEVAKVGLGAWTAAMSLTGPAGIGAAVAVQMAENKIDDWVDSKIDAIGSGYNECRNDKKKIADPKWIYDPSGYVYEAVPENRLEGVKATVLYLDPETNKWVVWDAGPYEQINPQLTNSEGKYGWDVPAGKWKVVWEKDGYETQTSAVLDVPPPHTEVNAGLISRAAPQVEQVAGVHSSTGSFVDITFTKYLKVSDLTASAITVMGPDGKNIAGKAKFIATAVNPNLTSLTLSRTVRFEAEGEFDMNKTYQITVKPSSFKSYADVWMKDAFTSQFIPVEKDTVGPSATEAKANGMLVTLRFDETVGSSADLSKFLLNNQDGKITSAVTDVDDDRLLYLTLIQPILANQVVELTVLAGAITDEKGNSSIEKKLVISTQTVSTNALLAGLAVDSASLTPDFDPNQLTYDIQVESTIEQLQVTASVADAKAKIYLNGMESTSGVATSVLLPENGEISIRVVAEDGTTTKIYTIFVERVVLDNTPPEVTIDVRGGLYASPQMVTLTTSEPGTIYYTLDGSEPTKESQLYSGPILIEASTVLKYFAVDEAENESAVTSQEYTIFNPDLNSDGIVDLFDIQIAAKRYPHYLTEIIKWYGNRIG